MRRVEAVWPIKTEGGEVGDVESGGCMTNLDRGRGGRLVMRRVEVV